MAGLWKQWREQAQADHDKFKPDAEQVEKLLQENPADPELLKRKEMIDWYMNSLLEGIEIMRELEQLNNG
jgi:hypothetical protein